MESETAEQNRKARQREYYLKHREKNASLFSQIPPGAS